MAEIDIADYLELYEYEKQMKVNMEDFYLYDCKDNKQHKYYARLHQNKYYILNCYNCKYNNTIDHDQQAQLSYDKKVDEQFLFIKPKIRKDYILKRKAYKFGNFYINKFIKFSGIDSNFINDYIRDISNIYFNFLDTEDNQKQLLNNFTLQLHICCKFQLDELINKLTQKPLLKYKNHIKFVKHFNYDYNIQKYNNYKLNNKIKQFQLYLLFDIYQDDTDEIIKQLQNH